MYVLYEKLKDEKIDVTKPNIEHFDAEIYKQQMVLASTLLPSLYWGLAASFAESSLKRNKDAYPQPALQFIKDAFHDEIFANFKIL